MYKTTQIKQDVRLLVESGLTDNEIITLINEHYKVADHHIEAAINHKRNLEKKVDIKQDI